MSNSTYHFNSLTHPIHLKINLYTYEIGRCSAEWVKQFERIEQIVARHDYAGSRAPLASMCMSNGWVWDGHNWVGYTKLIYPLKFI